MRKRSSPRLAATIVAACVTVAAAFLVGKAYGELGTADVRKSCLVTEASASDRVGVEPGDFVDGDSGCIADELLICYSFEELELWSCSSGRP